MARLTPERIESFLQERCAVGLSDSMANHLRADLRTAWNWAVSVGILAGPNPTARVKLRKVAERAPSFLDPPEVARLLLELKGADRWMIATLCLSAVRKGELFGLRKSDVDLGRRLLMVRRSYGGATTKAKRERAVPIAEPLVLVLEAAMKAAPGELLFPKPDGSMRTEHDALGRRLRRALGRAGIVSTYVHSCRRCQAAANRKEPGKARHEERRADNQARSCPACGMALWVKPIPKVLRLHDTRHTTATLLLAAGGDLWGVSKMLGHADASITARVYGHLMPGYLQTQADHLSRLFAPEAEARADTSGTEPVVTEVAEPASQDLAVGGSVTSVTCPIGEEPKGFSSSPSRFATPLLPSSADHHLRGLGGSAKRPSARGSVLERETGFEPATLSLGS